MNEKWGKTRSGPWSLPRSLAMLLFLHVTFSFALVSVSMGATYTYTELLPPGQVSAGARAINNSEAVVGSGSDVPDALKGFMYSGGTYIPLLPPGWTEAYAYGINTSGVVAGSGSKNGTPMGFIYNNGAYTELLPPGWSEAYPYGINSNGVLVGAGCDGSGAWRGFIYSNGIYTVLLPEGWTEAYQYGINDSGVVVGWGAVGTTGSADTTAKGFIGYPPPPPTNPPPPPPPPPPAEQITDIVDFLDAALAAGDLPKAQVKALEKNMDSAANFIELGKITKACNQLQSAYDRNKKQLRSKDPDARAAATEVAQQIQGLMNDLGCK